MMFTKQELLEHMLETMIANLGYPVGMGIAPHPDTVKEMAAYAIRLIESPPHQGVT